MYDVIIVGGGPAGLSAALMLGRCRRRVLVCDAGQHRNAASAGVHGFLTRDCAPPYQLLRIAREQLKPYQIEFRIVEVTCACPQEGGFKVTLRDGQEYHSRKLLLATGVKDRIPKIEGMESLYGKSIHHCPYCDGWECRDQPLAVYGRRQHGYSLALSLKTWSDDLILFTDGPGGLKKEHRDDLALFKIPVREERISRLEGTDGMLERIVLKSGESIERRAMFFSDGQDQCCDLALKFGCVFTKGAVKTGQRAETNIPGLFVAGDSSKDVQFVIVAAAEGAKAAEAINEALQEEDQAKARAAISNPL